MTTTRSTRHRRRCSRDPPRKRTPARCTAGLSTSASTAAQDGESQRLSQCEPMPSRDQSSPALCTSISGANKLPIASIVIAHRDLLVTTPSLVGGTDFVAHVILRSLHRSTSQGVRQGIPLFKQLIAGDSSGATPEPRSTGPGTRDANTTARSSSSAAGGSSSSGCARQRRPPSGRPAQSVARRCPSTRTFADRALATSDQRRNTCESATMAVSTRAPRGQAAL